MYCHCGEKCVQETQRLGVHGLFRKFSKTIKIDIKFHKIKKNVQNFWNENNHEQYNIKSG